MAFDLSNGLSAAGTAVATTAGAVALEGQKAELEKEKILLADQLANVRDDKGRQFTAGESEKHRTWQSSEGLANRTSEENRTRMQVEGGITQAGISAAAHRYAADVGAVPPDVKTAQWYAKASPEEREAYRTNLGIKSGLPPWMTSGDLGGGKEKPDPGITPEGTKIEPPKVDGQETKVDPEVFKDIPKEAHATVKAMIDGRLPVPTSFAMAKPYWQAMMQYAQKVDPNFDATTWGARNATRRDFATGKSAAAITALNTALGHAGVLVKDFDALDNGIFPRWNALINNIGKERGSDKVGNAMESRDALASEARKVFAATGGGNLTELQEWQKNFPIHGSPEQQRGAMKKFVELLDSRLESLANQYNRGMGRTQDPLQLLDPKARQVYEKLTGQKPQDATGYQTGKPPASTAPDLNAKRLSPAEAAKLPPGTPFVGEDGIARVRQ